jgi:cysteine desulfurase
MAVNNETGVVQPIPEIAALCEQRGIVFHTDAVQAFGKQRFENLADFPADLVTLCGHKFHGPKGAGALYVRSPLQLQPILHGGPQENERRPGTENIAAIAGLVAAMEKFIRPPVFSETRLRPLTARLEQYFVTADDVQLVGGSAPRVPNTAAFVVKGCDSIALLAALDLAGICASSGSACSAGSIEPSHVLIAQGYSRSDASSFVRFSLGRENHEADVAMLIEVFPEIVRRIRAAGRR